MPYNSGPLLPRPAGSVLSALVQESNRLHYHLESSLRSFSLASGRSCQYCFGISTRIACTFFAASRASLLLLPSYWGQGIATEAARAVRDQQSGDRPQMSPDE